MRITQVRIGDIGLVCEYAGLMRMWHVYGVWCVYGRMRIGEYWRIWYWLYVCCLYWCCCRFMGFWGFLFVWRFCVGVNARVVCGNAVHTDNPGVNVAFRFGSNYDYVFSCIGHRFGFLKVVYG